MSAAANESNTATLPEEAGKALEESLTHLVNHSDAHAGARRDELARESDSCDLKLGTTTPCLCIMEPCLIPASEIQADAIHSHGPKAKGWITKFFPSSETVDKVSS